ncbi:hypothetical protein DFH08DRAFT_804217 [Mycena albidolilacea]|uniref:Uncharacterized protein n=1 Tax=Mycena albidolilacea TaxID=1033008 RepID=A0AAD7ABP7_9AGAR|nr:hypothetical protein DFH08DRAFT_804217 [Mycena albidolilacea]
MFVSKQVYFRDPYLRVMMLSRDDNYQVSSVSDNAEGVWHVSLLMGGPDQIREGRACVMRSSIWLKTTYGDADSCVKYCGAAGRMSLCAPDAWPNLWLNLPAAATKSRKVEWIKLLEHVIVYNTGGKEQCMWIGRYTKVLFSRAATRPQIRSQLREVTEQHGRGTVAPMRHAAARCAPIARTADVTQWPAPRLFDVPHGAFSRDLVSLYVWCLCRHAITSLSMCNPTHASPFSAPDPTSCDRGFVGVQPQPLSAPEPPYVAFVGTRAHPHTACVSVGAHLHAVCVGLRPQCLTQLEQFCDGGERAVDECSAASRAQLWGGSALSHGRDFAVTALFRYFTKPRPDLRPSCGSRKQNLRISYINPNQRLKFIHNCCKTISYICGN